MKKIVIAGGSGFLGEILKNHFKKEKYDVYILTRNPKNKNDIYWNGKEIDTWINHLENADTIINLAGKSVDCRYTKKNKKAIYDSRIESTKVLGLAINKCENPPKFWINSSTATIYDNSFERINTEDDGVIGDDFSMNIAKSWELVFNEINTPKTQKIILRTSIVLGEKGGAIIPLKKITKLFLGGKQASGKQKVSWIHEEDFANAIQFLIDNNKQGIFNLCVPKPTDNETLMKSLRKALNIPFGIPQPKWLIKAGAFLIGTEPELVTKSRNVYPEKLLNNGFLFKYTNIENALKDILH